MASYRGIAFNKLYHIDIELYLNLLEEYLVIAEENQFAYLAEKQNEIAFFKDIEDNIFMNMGNEYRGILPMSLDMNQYSNIFLNQLDECRLSNRGEIFIEHENIFNQYKY